MNECYFPADSEESVRGFNALSYTGEGFVYASRKPNSSALRVQLHPTGGSDTSNSGSCSLVLFGYN